MRLKWRGGIEGQTPEDKPSRPTIFRMFFDSRKFEAAKIEVADIEILANLTVLRPAFDQGRHSCLSFGLLDFHCRICCPPPQARIY